jgi:hypothetical protein
MADRNFERALRSAARRGRTSGVCPDAATLASYADRGLSAEEHAAIEAHLSNCMACADHLALLAAVDTTDDATVPAPAFDFGALIRKWGWLVPAMTAVLVVAVWLRTSDERNAVAPAPAAQRPAQAGPSEPRSDVSAAGRETPPVTAGESQAKRDADAREGRRKPDTASRYAEAVPLRNAAKSATPAPASEAEERAQLLADSKTADEKDKEVRDEGFALKGAPPTTPASPAATAAVPAPRDAREDALAKAAPEPTAGSALGGRMRKVARQESAAVGGVIVRTAFGRIDRSIDGGLSWTSEHDSLTDRIQVSVCPTATACWLGADNGAVFVRGADGQWTRHMVPPPTAAVQRIVAVDNQRATVDLSDGRRFVTVDGGITWTGAPAQR